MRNRTVAWMTLLVVIGTLVAVGQGSAIVVDQTGRAVTVPQPVQRIACAYGSGTYILYSLGVGDRVVAGWYTGIRGVDQAWDAMRTLEPRLADVLFFGDPNAEELVSRGAQLVLADASRHAAFAQTMSDLGVPTLLYAVETPEALVEAITLTGTALGGNAFLRALQLVLDYSRVLQTAVTDASTVELAERPRVLFVGSSPLRVASGDMYQTHLIEAAGGVSVSAQLNGGWNAVDLEQVLLWNPDVIVLPSYCTTTAGELLTDKDWQTVRAVSEGRVVQMPRVIAPIDTPVPESMLGIAWLSALLHPTRSSFDLVEEATSFYSGYYGYTLSAEELAVLSRP